MQNKQCVMCGEIKSIEEFYKLTKYENGRRSWCKDCSKKYDKKYQGGNVAIINKEQRRNNADKINNYWAEYHKNKIEKLRDIRENNFIKSRSDLIHILSAKISIVIGFSLKNGKSRKHWEALVNFNLQDLITHLEKQFSDGMTWNNQGKWHIHHKIPVSLWKFETYTDREFKQCWSLCNLQPLWARENIIKSNKT